MGRAAARRRLTEGVLPVDRYMTEASKLEHLEGVLDFLRAAEQLKVRTRSAYTSEGKPETVAEHSWRLCLMALALRDEFPDVNFERLLAICVVHDLGEAIRGDVPAPVQAECLARDPTAHKSASEREDLLAVLSPLSPSVRARITALWDEYEAASTRDACKARILQISTIASISDMAARSHPETRSSLGSVRCWMSRHRRG